MSNAELYTPDQLQQKIQEFKISDLYQRLETSEEATRQEFRELRADIKILDIKLDGKIHGLYQLIIAGISIPVLLFVINFVWHG
jgi:DNA-binding protein Fis